MIINNVNDCVRDCVTVLTIQLWQLLQQQQNNINIDNNNKTTIVKTTTITTKQNNINIDNKSDCKNDNWKSKAKCGNERKTRNNSTISSSYQLMKYSVVSTENICSCCFFIKVTDSEVSTVQK